MAAPISVIPLEDTPQCADSLLDAARNEGFVYITLQESDIPAEKIGWVFELSRKFFASPREEKAKCTISADNKGWSSMHSETLDPQNQRRGDFKEALNFGDFKDGKAQQPLPDSLVKNESELSEFADLCHGLCIKLLRLFAIALKIDPSQDGQNWFTTRHDRSCGPTGSILRLLYYPAIPPGSDYIPAVDVRAGAHSDYGSITLLFQLPHQGGLEILHRTTGWTPVPVIPNAILVNIGDLLSYWTAGLLRSTVHRVVFPKATEAGGGGGGEDRYSVVYFCHPRNEIVLDPIPSVVVGMRGGRGANEGTEMTAEEHLRGRLKATYGWKEGEEK